MFDGINRLTTRRPGLIPRANAVAARALSAREYVDRSYRVFASPRTVRFREMEYAVPRAAVPDLLAGIEAYLDRSGEQVGFPVEVRFAAADDIWLSTAYGRDTGYVAVHQYHRRDHEAYFRAVEAVAKDLDGRPHWGKLHFRDAESLAAAYPHHADFVAVRDKLDPDRVFGNRLPRHGARTMSGAVPDIVIPESLRPADGRFGSGPSKVPASAVRALGDTGGTLLGTSHRQAPVKALVARIKAGMTQLFGLPDGYEVVLGNGGSTAFWDVAAFCLVRGQSLHAVCGEFSAKFAAVTAGAPFLGDPVVLRAEVGSAPRVTPHVGPDVYAWPHNETSTGCRAAGAAHRGGRRPHARRRHLGRRRRRRSTWPPPTSTTSPRRRPSRPRPASGWPSARRPRSPAPPR